MRANAARIRVEARDRASGTTFAATAVMSKLAATPGPAPAVDPQRRGAGPRLLSSVHHEEVERQCIALLSHALADDPPALVAHWRRFERNVVEHIAAEEQLVLPGYSVASPVDARRVRREHDQLLELLGTLGLEVELHVIRGTTVRAFVAALRVHARHEDQGMYRWASVHLSAPVRAAVWTRLANLLEATDVDHG